MRPCDLDASSDLARAPRLRREHHPHGRLRFSESAAASGCAGDRLGDRTATRVAGRPDRARPIPDGGWSDSCGSQRPPTSRSARFDLVARTARPPARPRLRDRPGETRGPDAVVRASRVRADNRANPLSTLPSRDGHDLPAVAKPSSRPARDDPARPGTIGHRHRRPLRMEHDQRIHRQLPTRPRADSRRLPGPNRRIARGTGGRRPDQAGRETQPCQSRRDPPFKPLHSHKRPDRVAVRFGRQPI